MNIPIYQVPSVATQSMRQQSLYQQTYLDRNRMITDVFVQEHVSQTTWAMAAPPPTTVIFPGGANCPMPHQQSPAAAANHMGHMAYVPMPGVQYYAASSGEIGFIHVAFSVMCIPLYSLHERLWPGPGVFRSCLHEHCYLQHGRLLCATLLSWQQRRTASPAQAGDHLQWHPVPGSACYAPEAQL